MTTSLSHFRSTLVAAHLSLSAAAGAGNACAIGSGRNRCRGNNLAEEKDLKRPKGKNSMTGGATALRPKVL
jgi:hypothetical protein